MVAETLPLYYFGPIEYWSEVLRRDDFIYNSSGFIPKRSYYNRTNILTAQGVQTLSIPLIGGRGQKVPMHEVMISYAEPWNIKHLSALKTAYSKSPYYEYYRDKIALILNSSPKRLIDLNLLLTQFLAEKLKINHPIEDSSDKKVIEFDPRDSSLNPPYPQVFRDRMEFQPNLSILDLLFNLGPESGLYLKKMNSIRQTDLNGD